MGDAADTTCDAPTCVECTCEYTPSLKQRFLDWWYSKFPKKINGKDGGLYAHAMSEFKAAGYFSEDEDSDMNRLMAKQVLELVELFATHGHSGGSAPFAIHLFSTLASYKLLTPLEGKDSEWNDVSEYGAPDGGILYQNNRLSSVFKDSTGKAWDLDAAPVYREPSGACYTKGGDKPTITFPYTQAPRVYIDVPESTE